MRTHQFAAILLGLGFTQLTSSLQSSAASLTLGSTNFGFISQPGQLDRFTFTGNIGQRLYYDTLGLDNGSPEWIDVRLIAPSGAIVGLNQNHATEAQPFYLPEAGTYTLVQDGFLDTTGDYNFRLVDAGAAPLLTVGPTNSVTLETPAATKLFRFNGTNGQRIVLQSIASNTNTATWRLVSPANDFMTAQFVDADLGTNQLPFTGTYMIIVEGTTETAPPVQFQFRITDASDAAVGASGFGTIHSATLAAGATNTFTYTASAGTVVYFDSLVGSGSAGVTAELVDPDGNDVFVFNGTYDIGPAWLPRSGTYTLLLIGTYGGDYSFRLLNLSASAPAITFGNTNSGTLSTGYRTDVFRFDGAPGQRLYVDSTDPDFDNVLYRVISPRLGITLGNTYDWADAGLIRVEEPGTFYFVVESQTPDTSAHYDFRLLDLVQSPAVPVGFNAFVTNTLTPGLKTDLYRFAGTAGQRLYFDGLAAGSSASWTLFGPDNANLAGNNLPADFGLTLPSSGTYALVVNGADAAGPVAYAFRIVTAVSSNLPLTLGALTSGTLATVGEAHRYTFTATAGMRLFYDGQQTDNQDINVRLLDPRGNVAFLNMNSDGQTSPFTVTEAGDYTLVLGGESDVLGSYSFRLIDLAQSPAATVALNTIISGTNNPGTKAALFRFGGTAGQRLFFDSLTAGSGYWGLYLPDNTLPVGFPGQGTDFEIALTETGTNVLLIDSSFTNSTGFSFRILTPTTTSNLLTLGNSISNLFAGPGDEHRYTFSGTNGQRLYYDALDGDMDFVTMTILRPDGTTVFQSGNSDGDAGLFTISVPGTYTLVQHNGTDGAANYRFRLSDLAAEPAITAGVVKSNQLIPRTQAHLYRFNGTSGQVLSLTSVFAASGDANWRLINTANGTILGPVNIQNNLGTVTLPVNGTYAVAVEGSGPDSGSLQYQILVTDLTGTPPPPAGLGDFNGTVGAGNTNFIYFSAPAGMALYVDCLTNNGAANLTLFDTNGTPVFVNLPGASGDDPGMFILPTRGIYTLQVVGDVGGDYRFRLLDMAASATALGFGTNVSGSFSMPFETRLYRFTGAVGQRLLYDGLEADYDNVIARLISSTASQLFYIYNNADADNGLVTLAEPGVNYLVLVNLMDDTVDYQFRLLDMAQSPAQNASVGVAVGPATLGPYEALPFRFVANAGQFFFDGTVASDASWNHYRPDGDGTVASAGGLADMESFSTQPGTNVLVLFNNTGFTQFYAFRIIAVAPTTNAATVGSTVTGTLGAGQERYYTFTASLGQRIYFDARRPPEGYTTIRLLAPSGELRFDVPHFSDVGPMTLTESGIYVLALHNHTDTATDFDLRILDVSTQPVIGFDTNVTGVVALGTTAQLFQFNSLANLSLLFDDQGTPPAGSWLLYGPNNQNMANAPLSADFDIGQTPVTATYLLVLTSQQTNAFTYSFRIVPGNHAPVPGTPGNRNFDEMTTITLTNTATDLEAPLDRITFSLDPGAPASATINPTTGVFTWTPGEADGPAVYPITVRVTDDGIPPLSGVQTFQITVNESNRPPSILVPADQTINELTALNVSASATDPDLPTNTLAFTLISPPAGMSINTNTGAISWTPTEAQGRSTNIITVVVSDTNPPAVNPKQLRATNTFVVVVNEMNLPPVLTLPTNQTINELVFYTNNATATDSDLPANSLVFALVSGPSNLTVSPAGAITWTPSEAQGPSTNTVTISVTDTNPTAVNITSLSVTSSFTLTVREVNLPPVLGGPLTNRTVSSGQTISFTATATDPDLPANTLGFSLVSPPAGATINSVSGLFQWRIPAFLGNSTNLVQVRVTDNGQPNANDTKSFSVIVNPLSPVTLTPIGYSNGNFRFRVNGAAGPDYVIVTATNLTSWSDLATNLAPVPPFEVIDPGAALRRTRNYRVRLSP